MMPPRPAPQTFPSLPAHCPVTGLPVHGHSSWRYLSPEGSYRLRVSVIGDRIVWLQPQGYVRLENARQGMALLADVLFSMMPAGASFIAMDDYSAITGASLDARRYIIKLLRQARRLKTYIVYAPPQMFRLGLSLGRRLAVFPCDMVVAHDYAEAAMAARDRLSLLDERSDGATGRNATRPGRDLVALERPAMGMAEPLAGYAGELLESVGGIYFESYGLAPTFRKVPRDHPFRPVYDVLGVLRDDMRAILQRHREARCGLQQREKELTEKQAMFHETHTTLKILLEARQESRRRHEHRVKNRFHSLLQPLVDGLQNAAGDAAGHELIPLLNHVIHQIGSLLPYEERPMPTPFTPRERLIAFLFIAGHDASAIARILGLSRRTIENHCQRMRIKLGLKGHHPTLKQWLGQKEPDESASIGSTP